MAIIIHLLTEGKEEQVGSICVIKMREDIDHGGVDAFQEQQGQQQQIVEMRCIINITVFRPSKDTIKNLPESGL